MVVIKCSLWARFIRTARCQSPAFQRYASCRKKTLNAMFLQKLYFCGEFAMDHLDELRKAMKYDERAWRKQTSISNDWLEGILGVAEPPEKQIYQRFAAQNDCTYVD